MYIVTRKEKDGNIVKDEYKTFCYAVNQLWIFLYDPAHGDYTVAFTRRSEHE